MEAIVKRNHERAADALRALLPALHSDMLKPPEAGGPSNGASVPEIQVHACPVCMRAACHLTMLACSESV